MDFFRESDIEKAFCKYIDGKLCLHVIGRQVELPSGRVDILARETVEFTYNRPAETRPVVIEIKKGKIDLASCGQVLSYAEQIKYLIARRLWSDCARLNNFDSLSSEDWIPNAIVVGSSVSKEANRFYNSVFSSGGTLFFYTYEYVNGEFVFDDLSGENESYENARHDSKLENLISSIVAFHAEG